MIRAAAFLAFVYLSMTTQAIACGWMGLFAEQYFKNSDDACKLTALASMMCLYEPGNRTPLNKALLAAVLTDADKKGDARYSCAAKAVRRHFKFTARKQTASLQAFGEDKLSDVIAKMNRTGCDPQSAFGKLFGEGLDLAKRCSFNRAEGRG